MFLFAYGRSIFAQSADFSLRLTFLGCICISVNGLVSPSKNCFFVLIFTLAFFVNYGLLLRNTFTCFDGIIFSTHKEMQ